MPIYICRYVINAHEILKWAEDKNLICPDTPLMYPQDLHCSIIASTNSMEFENIELQNDILTVDCSTGVGGFMDQMGSYVVLRFTDERLTKRHGDLIAQGVKSPYPQFKAHISIKHLESDEAAKGYPYPYYGRIILGPETLRKAIQ